VFFEAKRQILTAPKFAFCPRFFKHCSQEAQYAAKLDFLIVVAASGRTCSYKLIAVRTLGLRLTAPSRSPTAPDTPCISSKAAGQGGRQATPSPSEGER